MDNWQQFMTATHSQKKINLLSKRKNWQQQLCIFILSEATSAMGKR